ncbi:MAG: hypothetical protein M1370_08905 [Bacteroidetes bacterium]|nr:hypothetical protein [Bacteroidota bacterium]MCL5026667.1 hypothetical protein [Chloroflexota bacterium]
MPHSYELKLARAVEHLDRAEEELVAWTKCSSNAVRGELNNQTGEFVFTFESSIRFPGERLGLLVGDCLHNLRSALDHLAYNLAVKHRGEPLPGRAAETSEFPILGTRPMTPKEERSKIGCIEPAARAIIKGLQPYHRGDDYNRDPLWILYELERIDKHRLLHVVVLSYDNATVGGSNIAIKSIRAVPPGAPLENGTEVCSGRVSKFFPDRPLELEFHFPLQASLVEGVPLAVQPIIPAMRGLVDYVEEVILLQLRPFL